MEQYYAKRASEYEEVYLKPERQEDIKTLKQILEKWAKGLEILDLGCGTGYWTEGMSYAAKSIHGIDINKPVLEIATKKNYACPVTFSQGSYYELEGLDKKYDAVFGGFIYSHIPIEKTNAVIHSIRKLLKPNGVIVLFDNKYVEGSSTPISRTDALGNTFQQRRLNNGETYEVLKNFPERKDWETVFEGGEEIEFSDLTYYWILKVGGGGLK